MFVIVSRRSTMKCATSSRVVDIVPCEHAINIIRNLLKSIHLKVPNSLEAVSLIIKFYLHFNQQYNILSYIYINIYINLFICFDFL